MLRTTPSPPLGYQAAPFAPFPSCVRIFPPSLPRITLKFQLLHGFPGCAHWTASRTSCALPLSRSLSPNRKPCFLKTVCADRLPRGNPFPATPSDPSLGAPGMPPPLSSEGQRHNSKSAVECSRIGLHAGRGHRSSCPLALSPSRCPLPSPSKAKEPEGSRQAGTDYERHKPPARSSRVFKSFWR